MNIKIPKPTFFYLEYPGYRPPQQSNNYRNPQNGLSQNGFSPNNFNSGNIGNVMQSTREKYGPYCNGGQEYADCTTPDCQHPTCLFRVAKCEPEKILNCQPGCRCPQDRPFWVQQIARCVSQQWCDENGPPPRAVYGGKNVAKLKAAYNLKTAELMSRSISNGKKIDFNDFMIDANGESTEWKI